MTLGTHSIASAVSALEKKKNSRPAQSTTASTDPTDIVALVTNRGVLTLQSPPTSTVSSSARADIYITDPSIGHSTPTKVSLYGSSALARIASEQILPGDIIRFNNLRLGRRHVLQNRVSASAGSNAPINFEHDRSKPDPGLPWYRLGRIRIAEGGEREESSPQRAILIDDQRSKHNFPQEMRTADDRIQELIAWYPSYTHQLVHTRKRARIHGSRAETHIPSEGMIGVSRARSLSPLPCKRRTLAEVQMSAGVLSNIQVHITHCDSQVLPQSTNSSRRQRPRSVASFGGRKDSRQILGFATVTDESGAIMTLIDQGGRFGSIFKDSVGTKTRLALTNVLSKKQSEIDGRVLGAEEVILWPTHTTVVSVLLDDPRLASKSSIVPPPPEDIQSQEGLDATQPTQNHLAFHSKHVARYVTFTSAIIDLLVKGKSIGEHISAWDAEALRIHLLQDTLVSSNFASATIRLSSIHAQKGGNDDSFFADGTIVQSLCGGISPSDWQDAASLNGHGDRNSATFNEDDGPLFAKKRGQRVLDAIPGKVVPDAGPTMGCRALAFLRSLLGERTELEWTIDLETEPSKVVRVSLPKV